MIFIRKKEKKTVPVYSIIIFIPILMFVNSSACSTTKQLRQQRLNLLNAKYDNVKALHSSLTTQPEPEISCDFSLFISIEKINKVLAGVDNVSGPLTGIKETVFHINSIRTHFDDGFPEITIKAWAEHTRYKFRVDLELTAVLELRIPTDDLPKATIKVHVKEVVPRARWGFLNLKFRGFIKDLIHLKISSYAQLLPELSFPLKSEINLELPAQTKTLDFNAGDGRIIGNLFVPGISGEKSLEVKQILFLSDGIHVYLNFK
jgi:hypothetical protein